MATLTVTQQINEACEQVGNTGLATRMLSRYPDILRSLYEAAPWPFVKRHLESPVAVAAGQTSVDLLNSNFYAGATSMQDGLMSINRAVIAESNSASPVELEIIHGDEADPQNVPAFIPTTRHGIPAKFIVEPNAKTAGVGGVNWRGFFDPLPSKAFNLMVWGNCIPSESYVGSTKVVFTRDDLIIQALYCFGLRHQQDERAFAELQELKKTLGEIKAGLLATSGKGRRLQLSRRTFGSTRAPVMASQPWTFPSWWG
ncbi:hypothetical protein [Caudoviricetes sp.]|nr:hypothetical protein [Caudoviricetes sp.]